MTIIEVQASEMRDDDFLIEWQKIDLLVEFKVFEVTYWESWSGGTHSDKPGYTKLGSPDPMDTTEDRNQAEVFASGSIKWDGCMNMKFDAQESCMLHFCSRRQAEAIGRMLGRIYEIARDAFPSDDTKYFD